MKGCYYIWDLAQLLFIIFWCVVFGESLLAPFSAFYEENVPNWHLLYVPYVSSKKGQSAHTCNRTKYSTLRERGFLMNFNKRGCLNLCIIIYNVQKWLLKLLSWKKTWNLANRSPNCNSQNQFVKWLDENNCTEML